MSHESRDMSHEELERTATEFLEIDLARLYPDHDIEDGMLSDTIGPLDGFVRKHAELEKRLSSGDSEQARTELLELGIDPSVFIHAFNVAESGIASVLGWQCNGVDSTD